MWHLWELHVVCVTWYESSFKWSIWLHYFEIRVSSKLMNIDFLRQIFWWDQSGHREVLFWGRWHAQSAGDGSCWDSHRLWKLGDDEIRVPDSWGRMHRPGKRYAHTHADVWDGREIFTHIFLSYTLSQIEVVCQVLHNRFDFMSGTILH